MIDRKIFHELVYRHKSERFAVLSRLEVFDEATGAMIATRV